MRPIEEYRAIAREGSAMAIPLDHRAHQQVPKFKTFPEDKGPAPVDAVRPESERLAEGLGFLWLAGEGVPE